MAKQTLRDLAKEHAQGTLDKETYKKARADLIQGIISNTIPVQDNDYPPLVEPPEPESLDDTQRRDDIRKPLAKAEAAKAASQEGSRPAPAPTPAPEPVAPTRNKSNIAALIVIGIAVLMLIMIGVYMLMGGAAKKPQTSTAMSTTGFDSSISAVQSSSAAQDLIRAFLENNNWSSAELDAFRQQWLAIPAEDISASQNSLEMGQLTNAIYKQMLEERALSGLVDDNSSVNKQQQLAEFATALGIDDPRISLPE